MFSEDISESNIDELINKFEGQRKFIFDKLKKDLEGQEEKNYSNQMSLVSSIQQNLIKLKKLKQKIK